MSNLSPRLAISLSKYDSGDINETFFGKLRKDAESVDLFPVKYCLRIDLEEEAFRLSEVVISCEITCQNHKEMQINTGGLSMISTAKIVAC